MCCQGSLGHGAEVSEQPGQSPEHTKHSSEREGKERDGFFAIQLTLEAPRERAGKSQADQSSLYVPGLSRAAWHKGLAPLGAERRAPVGSAALSSPQPCPGSGTGGDERVLTGLRPPLHLCALAGIQRGG